MQDSSSTVPTTRPKRRPSVGFGVALFAIGIALLSPPAEAEAQRFFQRLRQRVAPQAPASRPPATPARRPQPATRTAPARSVSPSRRPSATATSPAATSPAVTEPLSWRDALSPTPGRDRYGYSILADTPLESESRANVATTVRDSDRTGADAPATSDTRDAKPTFGIEAFQAGRPVPGIEVADFYANSRAPEAGLRVGDVIVAMNGRPTPTIAGVVRRIADLKVGSEVRLRVSRDGSLRDLNVPLVASPSGDPSPRVKVMRPVVDPPSKQTNPKQTDDQDARAPSVGVSRDFKAAAPASDLVDGAQLAGATGQRGVVVESVAPNTAAAATGLDAGDRIVAVDGVLVKDLADWSRLVARLDPNSSPQLKFVRGSNLFQRRLTRAGENASQSEAGSASPEPTESHLLGGVGSFFGGLLGPTKTTVPERPTPVTSGTTITAKSNNTAKPSNAAKPSPPASPPAIASKPSTTAAERQQQSARRASELKAEIERLKKELQRIGN